MKRINYSVVKIATRGGTIELLPATTGGGWVMSFSLNATRTSHGVDIETAATALGEDLRSIADEVCADLKAFIERNK